MGEIAPDFVLIGWWVVKTPTDPVCHIRWEESTHSAPEHIDG